ncbi:lipocalin-like domain-containing protein [Paracoccus isoporae]|uniref:lipocalin-like domain-containing protein n=1 Tax=Paracoccus isoporae TaxID=591205 RepID=UPI000B87EA2B|nr:lipocalin-like domain-containing protein [Paracoccus isoporae]
MNRRALILSALAASQARAQGFAGLGTESAGYAMPDPARPIRFPQDHAPHPRYRIEWWYLTAPLSFEDGTELGIQWTLFRSALSPEPAGPGGAPPQAWLGHAAVTTADLHVVSERYARGGTGQAGATAAPFAAWIDEWQMQGATPADLTLSAAGPDFRYSLRLRAQGPLIRHGQGGYSVKSQAGQASYYYSQPFYDAAGTVDLGDGPRAVSGAGWLDREWSSQPLAEDQSGWDWFSLNLDDGRRLMAFRLRGAQDYKSGTLIGADGKAVPLGDGDILLDPAAREGGPPTRWRLRLPGHDLDVTITALNPDAYMATRIPYWEGPVAFEGTAHGRGYLEMTGYTNPR